MAYSVSKAAGEWTNYGHSAPLFPLSNCLAGLHLMKALASSQSPKIRVNAVLPGLLLTEWVSIFEAEAHSSVVAINILIRDKNFPRKLSRLMKKKLH